MGNDKYKQIQSYFEPKYDSDEDLDKPTQDKIKEQESNREYGAAEDTRTEAWKNANMYPKLKRMVKGAWYGDKRKSDE